MSFMLTKYVYPLLNQYQEILTFILIFIFLEIPKIYFLCYTYLSTKTTLIYSVVYLCNDSIYLEQGQGYIQK